MADVLGRWRRWLERGHWTLLGLTVVYGVLAVLRVPVAWPYDFVANLGGAVDVPELRAPADGLRRLVVLQHGMWRTSQSMARLERTLRQNGYEVLNPGYASTEDTIEAHAARLAEALERRLADAPVHAIAFVGHSMGGLVIEQYLRRPDAREPWACVYIATPHRGAILADHRHHWFPFRWVMGERAAGQLRTTDALHRQPIPWPQRSGAIVGDIGAGNASIPGADDGTVGVGEATFPGAAATAKVPFGHTRIAVVPPVHRLVLRFLLAGDFDGGQVVR